MKSYTQLKNITWAAVIGFGLFGYSGLWTPAEAQFNTATVQNAPSPSPGQVGVLETLSATVSNTFFGSTVDPTGSVDFTNPQTHTDIGSALVTPCSATPDGCSTAMREAIGAGLRERSHEPRSGLTHQVERPF